MFFELVSRDKVTRSRLVSPFFPRRDRLATGPMQYVKAQLTSFWSSSLCLVLPCMAGGGGSGLVAMGTQPMAAARANGSHAATEAMFGAIVKLALSRGKNTKISFTLFPVQKRPC